MKKEEIQTLFKSYEDTVCMIDDTECWRARELQKLLGYQQGRDFNNLIDKAKEVCNNAEQSVTNHFADVSKMVELGSGLERSVEVVILTRYACNLVAQNDDPRKPQMAFAQTYSAVQTRRIETSQSRPLAVFFPPSVSKPRTSQQR